jgi:hypothetical protein
MGRFLIDRNGEILEAAGAKKVYRVYIDKVTGNCSHQHGTTRMGDDPDSSVLNHGGDDGPAADLRGLPQAIRGRSSSSSPAPTPTYHRGRSTPSRRPVHELSCTRPTDKKDA